MSDQAAKPPMIKRVMYVCVAVLPVFAVSFIYQAARVDPLRSWQAYLINWLFWSGMAMGGVIFAAILEVTGSVWGRPMKRVAEGFASFLPVSFVLFILMWPGMAHLYPWVDSPVPGLERWLSKGFVFGRDIAALLILYSVSFAFIYYSVRPDVKHPSLEGAPGGGLRQWWSRGWKGDEQEVEQCELKRRYLAPAVIIVYGLVYSLLAYDLVMSIVPTWYSTLFGAYISIINIFGALAMVALITVAVKKHLEIESALGEPQWHDMGKLMFGFCILSLDFFWSQFLVIWYGNLPEETGFVLIRAYGEPWKTVSWLVLFGGFVAPFFLLLRRGMKADPRKLFVVSAWIVIMIWFERFILVAPSAWPGKDLPLGAMEVMVTAGFGALFLLCFLLFMTRLPTLPLTDPVFLRGRAHHHVLGEPDTWGAEKESDSTAQKEAAGL